MAHSAVADPMVDATLPDRDYDWGDETVTFSSGLEVVMPDVETPRGPGFVDVGDDRALKADEFGYVVGGLEEYLETHGDGEIDIPQYYSRFDEKGETYLGGVTAANNSFGVGATPSRLEDAVRAATGGGRFSSKATSVIGCGKHPFIVQNNQGAFAFTPIDIGRPDGFSLEDYPYHEVSGLSVPEDTNAVREGLAFVADALPSAFGIELTEHTDLSQGYHYFRTDSGVDVRIKGYHLASFAGVSRDPAAVLGEMEYDDPWKGTFSAEWDEVHYPIGTPLARRGRPIDQRPRNDVVVGYSRAWADPRRSRRVALSSRVKAKARYHRLKLSATDNGLLTATHEVTDETVGETKPEEKNDLATWKGTQ